jgi:hypothetical protein
MRLQSLVMWQCPLTDTLHSGYGRFSIALSENVYAALLRSNRP